MLALLLVALELACCVVAVLGDTNDAITLATLVLSEVILRMLVFVPSL